MLRLKNKTALITGGAKGAGAASARRFAEEGERVMIADRDAEAAACFSDKMRAEGFDIGWVHADVALVEGAHINYHRRALHTDAKQTRYRGVTDDVFNCILTPVSGWPHAFDRPLSGTAKWPPEGSRPVIRKENGGGPEGLAHPFRMVGAGAGGHDHRFIPIEENPVVSMCVDGPRQYLAFHVASQ